MLRHCPTFLQFIHNLHTYTRSTFYIMSGFDNTTPSIRPEHHIHSDADPIPGNRGVDPVDYSAESMERNPSSTWKSGNPNTEFGESGRQTGGEHHAHQHQHKRDQQPGQNFDSDLAPSNAGTGFETRGAPPTGSGAGATAFNSERPMGVQPSSAGGVAIGGRDDLPEGKASAMDKMIGKTEKVVGKMTKKPEMHERGELRETGGKAAATGQVRAAHD
ncbi:hypothetical protein CPB85DRAFT_79483 [Mucidula mucida]|nr:hypothetical protein CPB85DRAFT_79483 [Mucidula mucida]